MPGMDPRNFRPGTQVEVCPFRGHHAYHYIAHLDGERGVVESGGQDGKVSVRLACNRAKVGFSASALKIVTKTEEKKKEA